MSQSRLPNGVELEQESSDDSDEAYTVESGLDDWYYGKANKTKKWYRRIMVRFRKWLQQKYQRDLDRCRKKHIKAYLTVLSETNSQVRPVLCVLKSCFKHLKRLDVIDKDPAALFKLEQQLPTRVDRNLTSEQVRKMFAKCQLKKNKVSFHLLQILVYSGIRIGACSKLRCSDVVKSTTDAGDHYTLKVVKAKGGKSRNVPLKKDIGKSLHQFAQQQAQKGSIWLFPSPQKANKPLTVAALSARIKTITKSCGLPHVSCHWYRHFFASASLQNGCDLATLSKTLGHSSL